MSKEYLSKAIGIVGGQVALAAAICSRVPACRVRQGHIWKWLNISRVKVPPAEYTIAIAQAVDFQITPHDLRPDIYPNPEDGLPRIQEAA